MQRQRKRHTEAGAEEEPDQEAEEDWQVCYDKILFTEYAKPTARKSSKSFK